MHAQHVLQVSHPLIRLIIRFQKEFRKVVTYSDDIELENFCALSNSNVKFISFCREFLESCQEVSGVPLDVLQKAFQSNFVNKTFTEVSNTSYFRLQDLVKEQVAEAFLSIKDYRQVVIVVSGQRSKNSSRICL